MVKLPLKTLALWRARLSAVFLLLCVAFAHFLCLLLPVLIALYFLLFFWYYPKLFKSYQISIEAKRLILCYGVLFCRQKVCFFEKAPVIYAFSTPLARLFKLELVILRTTYGFIMLPEVKLGEVCKYVQV